MHFFTLSIFNISESVIYWFLDLRFVTLLDGYLHYTAVNLNLQDIQKIQCFLYAGFVLHGFDKNLETNILHESVD